MREEFRVTVNDEDFVGTESVLNYISLLASVASLHYRESGLDGCVDEAQEVSDTIYSFLKGRGVYESC